MRNATGSYYLGVPGQRRGVSVASLLVLRIARQPVAVAAAG